MNRLFKAVLASLLTLTTFSAPAHAATVTLNGAVTAAKDVSLVGTTVQLEAYDADADTYSVVATATATPSPAPTSTRAPYSFANVADGIYRVRHVLIATEVPTSRFGFTESPKFTVENGKISVDGKASANIPDLKMNMMGKYYVKATDAIGGDIVPNVIFTISGDFEGQPATFQSFTAANQQGTAVLPIPSAGTYSVNVIDPSGMHVNFTSRPDEYAAGFNNALSVDELSLTPAGKLSITITTNGGKDVVGGGVARIYQSDNLVDSAVADKSGVAKFSGLAEGDYVLYAGGPDGSLLKDSAGINVKISAGDEKELSVKLINGLTISGVVSAGASPVDKVRIDVKKLDEDGNEIDMSPAQSDKDGSFTTNGMSAGTYNLYFYDESSARKDYHLTGSALGIVVGDSNVTGVNASLPAASVIAGTVKNQAGKAVRDVTVQLTSTFGENIKAVQTDDNGQYQIPQIEAGQYELSYTSAEYRTAFSGKFDTVADKLTNQDSVLSAACGVSGKVVAAKGGAVAGLKVSIYASSGSGQIPVDTVLTQDDGTYAFDGLKEDTYRIKYDGTSASPVLNVFWQGLKNAPSNPLTFEQAADIQTHPKQVTSAVNPVPAEAWKMFSGTLLNGEVPLANSTVVLHNIDNSDVFSGDGDDGGGFSVAAPNGKYRAELLVDGFAKGFIGEVDGDPSLVRLYGSATVINFSADGVKFENDWSTKDWQVDISGTGGTVVVKVLNEDKESVDTGVLVAYNMQGVAIGTSSQPNDDGNFAITALRGNYYFSFEAPGDYGKRYLGDTVSLADTNTASVTVANGKSYTKTINVVALPVVTLKVFADTASDAAPYQGEASVEVYTIQNGKYVLSEDLSTALSDGVGKIGLARGGSYRIRVVPDDLSLTPIWYGSEPTAETAEGASSLEIPATGKMPTLDKVVLNVKASFVSGKTTDLLAKPIQNTEVQLISSAGDVLQTVLSREDGVYNLYRINPGTYSLQFTAEKYRVVLMRNLVLEAGQIYPVNQSLKSASGITGKMLGSNGLPVVGATVELYSASGSGLTAIQSVATQDDGYYNLIGLSAGTYKIKFDGTTAEVPTPAFWYGSTANEQSFATASEVVTTLSNLTTGINPKPGATLTLFNATVLAGEVPIDGAQFTLVSSSGFSQSAISNANGLIRVSVPDGDYQVLVEAKGYPTGYVSSTPTGAVLDSIPSHATILHVAQGIAHFDSDLDLIATPLDLISVGGSLKVQILDGDTTVSEGLVKLYNRAGEVVATDDQAVSGTFQLRGLTGDFFVSYEQAGVYGAHFLGGTKSLTDPANILVRVREKVESTATIAVTPLPLFTVKVTSGLDTYTDLAFVNVYQFVDDAWTLQPVLSGKTRTGTYQFAAEPGVSYRVQVVPSDAHASSAWLGSPNALSVEQATSYTMPLVGAPPKLPTANLTPATRVTVPVKNGRPAALENVTAHLEVTIDGKFVEFARQTIPVLESDSTDQFVFPSVPSGMFPIRVTVGSSQTAEEQWTSTVLSADLTTSLFVLTKAAVPATVTGRVVYTDNQAVPTAVSLVTDNGDTYATVNNDGFGGVYTFTNVPLGVHFRVVPIVGSGFATSDGVTDFTARSGQTISVNFTGHYAVSLSGRVLDPKGAPRADALVTLYRLTRSALNVKTDKKYSVYSDAQGRWSFDGTSANAEVGKYALLVNGLDIKTTPRYFANALCVDDTVNDSDLLKCGATKPWAAALLSTDSTTRSIMNITMVLGGPDEVAPSKVKIVKSAILTTTGDPIWQWSGMDDFDGKALRSQIVIATAVNGGPMSKWSGPIDVYNTTYTLDGTPGTTYCLSVRMIDKSGNASGFIAASCKTVATDDTALKPAKATSWTRSAVKNAYAGKVTAAKKNVKVAVLNVVKPSAGTALCVYYVTGAKFGNFQVLVDGKKLGKPVSTKGPAGASKSICYSAKITAKSKISIVVPDSGNGVQIDGYAIAPEKPHAPKARWGWL